MPAPLPLNIPPIHRLKVDFQQVCTVDQPVTVGLLGEIES